ncbi:GTP-binding protein, putative [Plasmodium sp. gorilla clade G1]|nr:GTP-binding protein, putative [Plasmodium sp. gorilla clade G1]
MHKKLKLIYKVALYAKRKSHVLYSSKRNITFATFKNELNHICDSILKPNVIHYNILQIRKKRLYLSFPYHSHSEKKNDILINDSAYEDNECIYVKGERGIYINKKETINEKKKLETINKNFNEDNHMDINNDNTNCNSNSNSNSEYFENYIKEKKKNPSFEDIYHKIITNNTQINVEHINSITYNNKDNNLYTEMFQGNIENDTSNSNESKLTLKCNKIKEKNEALMKFLTEENDNIMIRNEKRFCDFLWVTTKSGKGGNPNYKKQRSKKLKGEGYGGHGGNVILKSKKSIYDLIKIEQKVKANNGEDFKENSRGKDGKDKIIFVPVGTIVRKRISCKIKNENNRKIYKSIFWYQFLNENEELLVARGGKGGISYSHFKKHDYRLPEKSETTLLELELRLLNDVAFIGIENSGKTSLCSSLSKYLGNINSNTFTTTIPHVSNINYVDGVEITLLDTPYLFFNAHKDKNKGKRILRHLYRSKLIVYVIDVSNDKLKNVDDLQIQDYYTQKETNEVTHNENIINKNINENMNISNSFCDINNSNIHNINYNVDNNLNNINNKHNDNSHILNINNNKKNNISITNIQNDHDENLKDYYNDTIKQIKMLRNELFLYNPEYLNKKELVVATKCDMLHKNSLFNLDSLYYRLRNIFPHIEVIGTSAKFGLGIKLLSRKIRELIYPQHILQNKKLYSKHIEDYVIPTYTHFTQGRMKLQNYELPEYLKHIYDYNYMENFDYFLKKKKKEKKTVDIKQCEELHINDNHKENSHYLIEDGKK